MLVQNYGKRILYIRIVDSSLHQKLLLSGK